MYGYAAVIALVAMAIANHVLPLPDTDITDLKDLPQHLQAWHADGTYEDVNGYRMFVKRVACRGVSDTRDPVVVFHGFPSSSFEFHKVVDGLCDAVGPVILFDHVGFGFSEKPRNARYDRKAVSTSTLFSYSCVDHAEQAVMLLEKLDVKRAHFVSHDMGDTILNEFVGRAHRRTLPARFLVGGFFQSITFTNGGMVYKHINSRITQTILTTRGVGPFAAKLIARFDPNGVVLAQQMKTVWSPTHGDDAERDRDIADINAMLKWHGGHTMTDDLIQYLVDRARYEPRWHAAITNLHNIAAHGRCGFVWGDSDAVAPMPIARTLHEELSKGHCKLRVLKGRGHFVQLEAPKEWVEYVAAVALATP